MSEKGTDATNGDPQAASADESMPKNSGSQSEERQPDAGQPAAEQVDAKEADVDQADVEQSDAEPAEDPEAELARLQAEVERLSGENARLSEEKDRLGMQYARLRADFENFRRRKNEEFDSLKATAAIDLVTELLPFVDNLERAAAAADESEGALAKGVHMVLRQFQQALAKVGVEPVPGVGEPFDPQWHEAVMQVDAPEGMPPGTVVEELQRGYRMGERLIRPGMVKVST